MPIGKKQTHEKGKALMEIVKTVELTYEGAFLLYRAIAAEAMINHGFRGDAFKATENYEMSFEEIKDKNLELWDAIIECDVLADKESDPESYAPRH